jgi:hypothetical protein
MHRTSPHAIMAVGAGYDTTKGPWVIRRNYYGIYVQLPGVSAVEQQLELRRHSEVGRHRYLPLKRLRRRINNSTTKVMRAAAAKTPPFIASEAVAERLASLCGGSSGPLYSG